MTSPPFVTVSARVARGHRVASGAGDDARFPKGTIRPQLPFFRAAIAGFDAYFDGDVFSGTLNLALDGCFVEVRNPEHFLRDIRWTTLFAPENFYLSPCAVDVAGHRHRGLLYMPDSLTKPDHVQPASIVEVLSARIAGLCYGDEVTLAYSPEAIAIRRV